MEGTADRPPYPPTFPKGHILSDDEEAKVDKAEERLEKYLSREGQVKTQIILSVSESLALMLQKLKTAKDTHWDYQKAQDGPYIPAALQYQLRNMRCIIHCPNTYTVAQKTVSMFPDLNIIAL